MSGGTVRGAREADLAVFRGIPFAAPPVGVHRFAAPQPVEAWDGVREAIEFGPPPPQAGMFGMDAHGHQGDDWLTVNVWSPDPSGALPVMVWIQGGAYVFGTSGLPEYDGAGLAGQGVVLVTFNYRVGPEGFVRIPGAPANRGLLDQVAALRWVRDNIAKFGGDADNVTIFGQSAGGGSVAALLAMPRAKGLFKRAIAQSVAGVYFTPALAADIAEACAAELGVPDLSTVDPELLSAAGDAILQKVTRFADRWGQTAHALVPFAPVVDGDVLPANPWEGITGEIDLLVGHTRHEQRLLTTINGVGEVTAELANTTAEILGPDPRQYRESFPDPAELFEVVRSDWLFRMPSLHLAEAQKRRNGKAYLYELTWEGVLGACHGLDVPLVFGNLTGNQPAGLLGDLDAAAVVSKQMQEAWLAFARTGDPGWPAYDTGSTRLFDVEPVVTSYPEEVSRRIWRDHPKTLDVQPT